MARKGNRAEQNLRLAALKQAMKDKPTTLAIESNTMAHLWHFECSAWVRLPLAGNRFTLTPDPARPMQPGMAPPTPQVAAALGCYEFPGRDPLWALLATETSAVRVNGQSPAAGLVVLHDRDEILLAGGRRFYFSTEEPAKVEAFPGGAETVFCARCRQSILPGTPSVRCPACGHWCEQTEAKPCWTYGPTCPLCDQATDFNAGLRWTPEEL